MPNRRAKLGDDVTASLVDDVVSGIADVFAIAETAEEFEQKLAQASMSLSPNTLESLLGKFETAANHDSVHPAAASATGDSAAGAHADEPPRDGPSPRGSGASVSLDRTSPVPPAKASSSGEKGQPGGGSQTTTAAAVAEATQTSNWRDDIASFELPTPQKGKHGGKAATASVNWGPAIKALAGKWDALNANMTQQLRVLDGATLKDKGRSKQTVARETVLLREAPLVGQVMGMTLDDPRLLGKDLSHARGWLKLLWNGITSSAQQHMAAFKLSRKSATARQSFTAAQKIGSVGSAWG